MRDRQQRCWGLIPFDRDALFAEFRDLGAGPVSLPFRLPQAAPTPKALQARQRPAAAASARCSEGAKCRRLAAGEPLAGWRA